MVTVRLLGGAKKSFSSDKLEIKSENLTIKELMGLLENLAEKDKPLIDFQNILIAVNGVDSSALQGNDTLLKNSDVVSIIPVVHGGGILRRNTFVCSGHNVEFMMLKKMQDPTAFLEGLRERYADAYIQGIQVQYLASLRHAKNVVRISLAAKKAQVLLSNKPETDILMRFSHTRQINEAIRRAGLKSNQDSVIIIIGKRMTINKIFKEIRYLLQPFTIPTSNHKILAKECSLTDSAIKCVISKQPLEDLLLEKSAILFH